MVTTDMSKAKGSAKIYFNPFRFSKNLPLKVGWFYGDAKSADHALIERLKPLARDVIVKKGDEYWIEKREINEGVAYIDHEGNPTIIQGQVPYQTTLSAEDAAKFRNSFCAVHFPIAQSKSVKSLSIKPVNSFNNTSVLDREIAMIKHYYKLPQLSPVHTEEENDVYDKIYTEAMEPEKIIEVGHIDGVHDIQENAERYDLRQKIIYTIDSETTKDIDDAIEIIKIKSNQYVMGIHIADVTEYVKIQSARDMDAASRGTSHYLADKVIHMLPSVLSEMYCSLNEGEDRLAVSVYAEIQFENGDFDIKGVRVSRSIIRSKEKLSYKKVEAIIDGTFEGTINSDVYESVLSAYNVSRKIIDASSKRVKNSYNATNIKYFEDKSGQIGRKEEIIGKSDKMIETFMVKANELVGQKMAEMITSCSIDPVGIGLYRVQKVPTEKDLMEYVDKLKLAGLISPEFQYPQAKERAKRFVANDRILKNKLTGVEKDEAVRAAAYREIDEAILNRSSKEVKKKINILETFGYKSGRMQAKAGLSDKYNESFHQALNINRYAWFTSPIRRYTDIVNHRQIKSIVSKEKLEPSNVDVRVLTRKMNDAGYAERSLNQRLLLYYLNDKIKQEMKLEVRIAAFKWTGMETFKLNAVWLDKYPLDFIFRSNPIAKIQDNGLTCILEGTTYVVSDAATISILNPKDVSPEKGYIMLHEKNQIKKIKRT